MLPVLEHRRSTKEDRPGSIGYEKYGIFYFIKFYSRIKGEKIIVHKRVDINTELLDDE